MAYFNDFSSTTISGGAVSGFGQPWGTYPDWEFREGRLKTQDAPSESYKLLTISDVAPFVNGEIVSLSSGYFHESMEKPIGRTRTTGLRISGAGPTATGVFASVYTTSKRTYTDPSALILVQVREMVNGNSSIIGSVSLPYVVHSIDMLMRIRLRVVEDQVWVKAWSDVLDEPEGWTLTCKTSVQSEGRAGLAPEGMATQEFCWVGVGVGESAPMGPKGSFTTEHADFSGGVKELAISMCYDLYNNGNSHNPLSETNIRNDMDAIVPGYRSARTRALEISRKNRLPTSTPEDHPLSYAHCSRFSGTLILNTIDPFFAADLTMWQNDFMNAYMNGWVQVGNGEYYDPSWCKPGDVWITRDPGHVFVWIGDHGGYNDVIAEAAFNGMETDRSRVGSMRRFYLNPTTGRDGSGRPYSAWRFVGRPEHQIYQQRDDGLRLMQAYQQTVNGIEQRVI